jgi:hypothetical protein
MDQHRIDLLGWLMESLPLVVSLSLTFAVLVWVTWVGVFEMGRRRGFDRGYWNGYPAGITDERHKLLSDSEASVPTIVETMADGSRRVL